MDGIDITVIAESPWLLPVLLLLVVGDAFLVVLPSETAVVALGSIAGATGSPNLAALVVVAALGAIVGDSLCFLIGHRVGSDRWRWQREGRLARQLERVRGTVRARPAVLIFTARYIPFARIAVNLTAGATGLPYRRFLPLSALAGLGWALYNSSVGLFFGSWLRESPILAVAISVVVAMALGLLIDLVVRRRARRAGD